MLALLLHPIALPVNEAAAIALGGFAAGAFTNRIAMSPKLSPAPLDQIVARPGASKYGVGLICLQDVPVGGRICGCEPVLSRTVPLASLDALPTAVRSAIHELYDGVDDPPGTCSIPLNYEQAIPLIAFINHSKRPSCAYDEEAHAIVALRRLRAGDEATVNYFEYQDPTSFTYRHAASGFSKDFARLQRSA